MSLFSNKRSHFTAEMAVCIPLGKIKEVNGPTEVWRKVFPKPVTEKELMSNAFKAYREKVISKAVNEYAFSSRTYDRGLSNR